jgi:hypothetical protein
MVIAVCDCVRCAVCGVRLSGIRIHAVCGSVRQSARLCSAVRQCAAVRTAVCGCLAVRHCAAVWQFGIFLNKFKAYSYKFR